MAAATSRSRRSFVVAARPAQPNRDADDLNGIHGKFFTMSKTLHPRLAARAGDGADFPASS
jgi:hypothetical protein